MAECGMCGIKFSLSEGHFMVSGGMLKRYACGTECALSMSAQVFRLVQEFNGGTYPDMVSVTVTRVGGKVAKRYAF